MNRLLSGSFLVLIGLVSLCLWHFPLHPLDGQIYALLAFALVLELCSIHLPTLGFVSVSFPIFFSLCFLPNGGPATTTLGMVVVLLLRSILRAGNDRKAVALEFLVDTISVTSALLLGGLLSESRLLEPEGIPVSLLALLASILTYWFLQVRLYGSALRQFGVSGALYQAQTEAVNIQARASGMCAPALLLLVLQEPWHILWTLPVFFALYQSNWERLSELRKARAEQNMAKVESLRKDKVLLETAKNMAALQSQKRLVQTCSASFAKTTNSQECFTALSNIFKNLLALDSVAVMLHGDQGLVPLFCQGHYSERFFAQNRTGIRENLIGKSWTSGEIQRLDNSDTRVRIFEKEKHAVAFPLHGQGVLYVGSESRPLDGEDFQRLATVAYQFSLSLQSTLREEALARTVDQVSIANRQIELGKARLLKLLEGSHKMTRTLETTQIVEEASRTLLDLFQPDYLLIRVLQSEDHTVGTPPPQDLLSQVIAKLASGELAYYLDSLESEEGERGFTGHQLSWEGRLLGFILMSSTVPYQFQKAQRRFLELLALHCSVMLTNSKLFSDVQKARKDLEESQAQLIQSSKLAAVGQLAAGVAHELNTPLGAVLLSLQAANRQLQKGRYEKVQDKLDDGVKGAQAAKEIVSKLLFYSREGREDRAEVSLAEVVRDTVQFLGSQITDDNIDVSCKILQDCKIQGNQNELQQILTNFLVNARDAILSSDKQSGHIEIEIDREDGEARLSVSDNGDGFSDEVKERAFEPFYTTKPVGQGTGLGLHVSRQIAERHGGRIELTSQTGKGAKLTLILPCSMPQEPK